MIGLWVRAGEDLSEAAWGSHRQFAEPKSIISLVTVSRWRFFRGLGFPNTRRLLPKGGFEKFEKFRRVMSGFPGLPWGVLISFVAARIALLKVLGLPNPNPPTHGLKVNSFVSSVRFDSDNPPGDANVNFRSSGSERSRWW